MVFATPSLRRQATALLGNNRSRARALTNSVLNNSVTSEFSATLSKLQDLHDTQVQNLIAEAAVLRRALQKHETPEDEMKEEEPDPGAKDDADVQEEEEFELWPEWTLGPDTFAKNNELISNKQYGLTDRTLKLKPDYESYSSSVLGKKRGSFNCSCKLSDLVISPISPQRMFWDILGVVFLMYDMIWIPVQVFSPPATLFTDVIDFTVALYWTLDIVGTFFTAYYSPKGEMVRSHRQIAWHYVKRWFLLDVMIVTVDWTLMATTIGGEAAGGEVESEDPSGLARLGKVIRVARILRTLRLLRLMKLRHIFFAIQERIDSEVVFILVGTVKNLLVLLFVNHVFACLWFLIGIMDEGDDHWVFYYKILDTDVLEKYMLSLHWSLTQFTPAGIEIHPRNVFERAFNVLLILIAMVGFSSFVSAITASMTRLRSLQGNELSEAFLLRRFLKENHISADLQSRVVRYIDMAVEVNKKKIDKSRVQSLNMLSGPLRVELQKELYLPHLIVHRFFERYATNDAAINQICFKAVDKMNLSRSDVLFQANGECKAMFFLTSGSLYYQRPKDTPPWEANQRRSRRIASIPLFSRVLTLSKDSYFCEHPLWLPWYHRGTMGALTDSVLLALDSEKFRQITGEYKDIFQIARAYAHQMVQDLQDFSDAHGCAWDLPKEVTHPKSYSPATTVLKSSLEQQQLEELKMSELLAACIEDDLDKELMPSPAKPTKGHKLDSDDAVSSSLAGHRHSKESVGPPGSPLAVHLDGGSEGADLHEQRI